MKRLLAIGFCLLWALVSFAQDSLCHFRITKSYLITDNPKDDTAFLKEKCRQAGLDLGLTVTVNRIPTNSRLVTPKPSKHLLKQGVLHLQLPMNATQDEFAVYHSDLFSQPSSINVLQVDNELITYRTMETSGNIHLFYQCTRGAFGTKQSAHSKNAIVYKLWDTPERTLLSDFELQNQRARTEARKLSNSDFPVLIFNDLKSYGYNEQGDTAIGCFLDTMRKYNPDKLLQGDNCTPASMQRLSRINENILWNESMRMKMVETLTNKQDYYRKHHMPWMIGNFQIRLANKHRKATTMEELEWFLSKAAAFDAGFGLDFNAETMKKHALTDEMLNTINHWETLRLNGAFSEEQKDAFKDPYGNWHLEKCNDTTYLLYSQHISQRYPCHFDNDRWLWNSPYAGTFALVITVEGKGSISELEVETPNGMLYFPCTVKANQLLIFDFDGRAYITDRNHNNIQEAEVQGSANVDEGESEVKFTCKVQTEDGKTPHATVRFITRGVPETRILSPQMMIL